jgi:hypothetical protein
VTEKRAAERFIYQVLSADAPLVAIVGTKIARGLLPQGTVPPYCLFSFMAGVMRNAIPGTIAVMVPLLYLVKGVTQGNSALQAFDIEDRIDAALGSNNGTVTLSGVTWQVGPWVKETHVEYDEVTPEGTRLVHAGAQYRAWVYRIS